MHEKHLFTPEITVSHMGWGGQKLWLFCSDAPFLWFWVPLDTRILPKNGYFGTGTPHTPTKTSWYCMFSTYVPNLQHFMVNLDHQGPFRVKNCQKLKKLKFWNFNWWFRTLPLDVPGWFRYQKMSHGLKFLGVGKIFWDLWRKGYLWTKTCFLGSENLKN